MKQDCPFLSKLDTEITRREKQNSVVHGYSLEKEHILYPFGNTGAGKTTFILYCSNVPLQLISDGAGVLKYGPKHNKESADALGHLEVGNKIGESCTVYLSATACNGFIFLDGPGFNDTGGPVKDIANAVALHSLMKNIPSFIPILFIEHSLFHVLQGDGVRELIQGFSALFSDIDLLEEYMFVVFTKVPEDVELNHIEKDLMGLKNAHAEKNTKKVSDILQMIIQGINQTESKMFGRVLIFRPLDTEKQEKFINLFKSPKTKQLKNPSRVLQFKLPPITQTHLENAMHQLKQQISDWLKEKETKKVFTQMIRLQKLSAAIPTAEETLKYCSALLDQFLLKKLQNAKLIYWPPLLEEGKEFKASLASFIEARAMLVSIENFREFAGESESIEAFDDWTALQFELYVSKISESSNLTKIGFGLKRMGSLAPHFEYLKAFNTHYSELKDCAQNKVTTLQKKVELTAKKVSKSNIDLLLTGLQTLHEAVDIQPYVTMDLTKVFQFAIDFINDSLDAKQLQVSLYLESSPVPPINPETLSDYQAIKAVCEHKTLFAFLVPITSPRDAVERPNRYQELKAKCIKVASEALTRLIQASKSAVASEMANENMMRLAKMMGEFDFEVKNYVEQGVVNCFVAFDSAVKEVLEKSPRGPDYPSIPQLFRKLDSYKWLDNYAPGEIKRIERKKAETLAHLDASLKALVKRIETSFNKHRYDDVVQHFSTLYGLSDVDNLSVAIPSYEEHKETAIKILQDKIRLKLKYDCDHFKLSSGLDDCEIGDFTLSDADVYLETLEKVLPIAKLVGSHLEIIQLKKGIIRSLYSQRDSILGDIIEPNEYKFELYTKWLGDFLTIQSAYPNLPEGLRAYERVKSACASKVEQLARRIQSLCIKKDLEGLPTLVEKLDRAIVLSYYLPTVSDTISNAQTAHFQIQITIVNEIKKAFDECDYFACALRLHSLPKNHSIYSKSLHSLTNQLQSMVAKIKNLILSIDIFTPTNEWSKLVEMKLDFEGLIQTAFKEFQPDTFFPDSISNIYNTFDTKFETELISMQRFNNFQLNELIEKLNTLERRKSNLNAPENSLPKTCKAIRDLRQQVVCAFWQAEKQIEDLKNYIETVDQFYSALPEQKQWKYYSCIRFKLASYSHEASSAPTEERTSKLACLRTIVVGFSNPDLKKLASEEYQKALESIEQSEKKTAQTQK